jgi:predicted dehydrogenase
LLSAAAEHDRKARMTVKEVGIIVHGATGRIGATQHLANALAPIRAEGGLVSGSNRIMPRLLLAGRNATRLDEVARLHGVEWTTDINAALANPDFSIFFDAAATEQRVTTLTKAIAAGKHIYSEKPAAPTVTEGLALLRAAKLRGLKTGVVEDKIYLPGLRKLNTLSTNGFFGRVTGFRLEFGWWVFDGVERASQRPSWNYKRATGGGLTLDMYPHWRYVLEGILGPIRRVVTVMSTTIPERRDEAGASYRVDVDDTSLTLAELANGAIGSIICSWATRVRRDDLLALQVDGTGGSAIAGLHRCWSQTAADTPLIKHFNPDRDPGIDYCAGWEEITDRGAYINPYRVGWENFLCHVVDDAPLTHDLTAGIRDVQLAQACYRSVAERKWVTLDEIVS